MDELFEINYLDVEENEEYNIIIKRVLTECFKAEGLLESKLYVSITLTTPEHIREFNNKYRGIDTETDVLSFPMFEQTEINGKIDNKDFQNIDVLGDMVISIQKVSEQAIEYGHSFERELAYMVVHSFYHLMGYDHIRENDKIIMREKEEFILDRLNIRR